MKPIDYHATAEPEEKRTKPMIDRERLVELAERCELAGIASAKNAPTNDLYARRAFYNLSVAASLRALATLSDEGSK